PLSLPGRARETQRAEGDLEGQEMAAVLAAVVVRPISSPARAGEAAVRDRAPARSASLINRFIATAAFPAVQLGDEAVAAFLQAAAGPVPNVQVDCGRVPGFHFRRRRSGVVPQVLVDDRQAQEEHFICVADAHIGVILDAFYAPEPED